MTAIQILKTAAAPFTLWIGVSAVIAGWTAAVAHGNFMFLPAVMCMVFCIFAQLFSNFTHRYFDNKHDYGENRRDGIDRCDDLDRPVSFVLKEAMKVTGVIAAMAGLWLLAFAGWWAINIAVILGICVAVTNLGPKPLSQSRLYPIMTFLLFGPIAVIGTSVVQSEHSALHILSWWDLEPGVVIGTMIGLMAMKSHLIYGAFHRLTGQHSSRTKFIGRYIKHAYVAVIVCITIAYVAVGVLTPRLLHISNMPWLFIAIPVLSGIVSLTTLGYTLKVKTTHLAWHISIYNLLAVAILSFIVLSIIGYPAGYLDSAPALL